jgi:flavin reductase (DIM6/NTAB) family NADH-FMN oxidoreductase RutF
VTSFLVAAGERARLLALLDPDADLTETLLATGAGVVHLLAWEHRDLAEMFAGTAPAPGGMFSHAEFEQTDWGPRLASAASWAGVRLEAEQQVGWSTLVTTVVEQLEVGDGHDALRHHRGRFGR